MFIQVITGTGVDDAALRERMEVWHRDLAPGAAGWLGGTGGTTADGRGVLLERFESEAAGRANSDRPEQGEWWAGTAAAFGPDPRFAEGTDVDLSWGGGSDEAGFVQVMQGTCTDPDRLRQLEEQFQDALRSLHPGLLGSVRLWTGGGSFTEAVYFTDEATARAGEAALSGEESLAGLMEEWLSLQPDPEFYDLTDPWLYSPR